MVHGGASQNFSITIAQRVKYNNVFDLRVRRNKDGIIEQPKLDSPNSTS